jgi:hypothetical protein
MLHNLLLTLKVLENSESISGDESLTFTAKVFVML